MKQLEDWSPSLNSMTYVINEIDKAKEELSKFANDDSTHFQTVETSIVLNNLKVVLCELLDKAVDDIEYIREVYIEGKKES